MNVAAELTRWVGGCTCVCSLILLGACGGGGNPPPTYTIGGTVAGLSAGSQVVLLDSGGDGTTVTANGVFTFPTALKSAASYAVAVGTAPAGEACTVSKGSGTVASANVTNVAIACNTTHTIGGVCTFPLCAPGQSFFYAQGGGIPRIQSRPLDAQIPES